jgi:hypothetical protein
MPTTLKYYKRDPNGLKRGEGLYYHRGKGYHSKYSLGRDKKIKAKGYRTNKTGISPSGKASRLAHTTDGKIYK